MMLVSLIYCGVLMLSWPRLCAALQASQGQQHEEDTDHKVSSTETRDAMENLSKSPSFITASDIAPQNTPCFLDDIFAMLRESLGGNGRLRNDSLALFAVCAENSLIFLQLSKETSENGLGVLYPTEVLLNEEDEGRVLMLTFDLSQSSSPMLNPVLLLAFENPFRMPDQHVTFSSQALNPNTQSPCISEETKYIILTAKEGHFSQTWRISWKIESTDKKQNLKDAFFGDTGSNISIYALLLFTSQRGTDTRHPNNLSHNTFLCELRRFLVHTLPQDPEAPLLNLESLQSLPSLPIGLSSSESLLAGLINSSGLTILSFAPGSMLNTHHEQLALRPALLEELRQRLEETVTNVIEMRKDEEGGRTTERLGRLQELCGFPLDKHMEGKIQFRAFLLLKALQTVSRAFEVQRGQRATRANPVRDDACGLRSLTVSLQRYLIGPNTANINNCQGSCTFPMSQTNNHAVLLNTHIESGNTNERAPCCVPVAYEGLEVVDLNENGTFITIKPNMVAKECECR